MGDFCKDDMEEKIMEGEEKYLFRGRSNGGGVIRGGNRL